MVNDVETYWAAEIGEPVRITYLEAWDEFDLWINEEFAITLPSLEGIEDYLARYSMVKENTT